MGLGLSSGLSLCLAWLDLTWLVGAIGGLGCLDNCRLAFWFFPGTSEDGVVEVLPGGGRRGLVSLYSEDSVKGATPLLLQKQRFHLVFRDQRDCDIYLHLKPSPAFTVRDRNSY